MHKKGLVLVLSTAIISGFSIFINKYGVSLSSPYAFAFLKNTVVALMLTSLFILFKDLIVLRQLKFKQWLLLVSIGLIGGSIPFLLFFKGLALTSAAQGSFVHKTMFIYVAILAMIFLKERLSKNFIIGTLLLLLGNLMLLKSFDFSFGFGDLLIFFATILWAVESVISKYTLRDLSSKTVAWGRMFFGSIFILGYLAASGQLSELASLSLSQISWVIITSVLLFAYVMTWYGGLKHVSVSLASAILLLGAPVTTLLSSIAGGKLNSQEIFSGILILFGLMIILGFRYVWNQIKSFKASYVRN